jgi:plasmid stabilization system protein ParE
MAAQRGVKAARRRLAEIRSTASGLVTYDRTGRRAEVTESRNLAQRL